ncbi:MAG: sugar ABC transporter ATP-binding protein [Caldisericum sp.]|uniref:sugar ABC transporter ATP-binding protein n=1 Tax=Caldisericum sp. TaxID=2499687 RepID=UPI003D0AEA4E
MEEVLKVENLSKEFPGVRALENVSFNLYKGEVHALVGENGAGKSTLIKILTGALSPTKGKITLFGKFYERLDTILTQQIGIAAVYQEMVLANYLNVVDNVFLGIEPSKLGFDRKNEKIKQLKQLMKSLNYEGLIDPKVEVRNLSAAQQGMVAIMRALVRNAKILIFDEPTASLSDREVKILFSVIRNLQKQGISIIYISHRLEEVFDISNRISVLKDGKLVGERITSETNSDDLIKLMVGRDIDVNIYDKDRKIGEEIFRCENLTNERIKNISFSLKSGEIVGIYGLIGSGRTEMARAIFGADKLFAGKLFINGKEIKLKSPVISKRHNLSYLPEDRRRQGLALQLSIKLNVNLASYGDRSNFGFVDLKKEKFVTVDLVKALEIKTPSISQKVSNLSGGTQQKVVVAKWLAANSKIFIMDEPTVGIDVGAKNEIYKLINKLAKEGSAILFISSYMPELISICDRIFVMREGKFVGEVKRQNFSEEEILKMAI